MTIVEAQKILDEREAELRHGSSFELAVLTMLAECQQHIRILEMEVDLLCSDSEGRSSFQRQPWADDQQPGESRSDYWKRIRLVK